MSSKPTNPAALQSPRIATLHRQTNETSVQISLNLDGTGQVQVTTGIGFFDHMLTLLCAHALFDAQIKAKGDLEVDFHHTIEDTGITLGQAIAQALGDKRGIQRYGWIYLPMDEALARVVLDCSGRAFLRFSTHRELPPAGPIPFQLIEEFCRALATNAALTLHVDLLEGRDSHHAAEAIFKGLGRALRMATRLDPLVTGIPSTKGCL